MTKVVKNLTLDAEAVRKGELYSRMTGTSVSQLVSDLLSRLPEEHEGHALSPAVGRLLGIGSGKADEASYRRYLEKKHAK
jgi:Family of unknown function (DUF6364)